VAVSAIALLAPAMAAGASAGSWPGGDPRAAADADFFRFANGGWLDANPIPADRGGFSMATILVMAASDKVHALLEDAAATAETEPAGERAKVGAYYAAFMDEARIEAAGLAPLAPRLAEIRAAQSRRALARLMGRANSTFFGSLFSLSVAPDSHDPDRTALYLSQAGLGSVDRGLYLDGDAGPKRAEYVRYVGHLLAIAGWPGGGGLAPEVARFEARIAASSWTAADERDESRIYNPRTAPQLAAEAPGFPWDAFFAAAGLPGIKRVVVVEPAPVHEIAALYAGTPLPTLKAWAAFHALDNAAPVLSHAIADAGFEFHKHRLLGVEVPPPRWQQAVSQVAGGGAKDLQSSRGALGDAVGRLYVRRWFDPHARDALAGLIEDLRRELRTRILASEWMSAPARDEALRKLAAYRVEIGVPERGDRYEGLIIRRDDLYGDVERSTAYAWARDLARLHAPADRALWTMTPQTVNAYNYAPFREVVFTAALLQPPAFDAADDAAAMYGGIGSIIGHELTHAFDDVGRRFDAAGRMREWWTVADDRRFNEKAARLVQLYSACEAAPGLRVDGHLTLGENIADIGGLQLAYLAYRASLHGAAAPIVDGLTGEQRFFLSFAKLRRGHRRIETLRSDLASDPHTPDACRVNQAVRNVDGWYGAFDVTPDAPLFLAPERRTRIW